MFVKYRGDGIFPPTVQVPGWSGGPTGDSWQPWHSQAVSDAAGAGIELRFQHQETAVPEVGPPFIRVSDRYYLLPTGVVAKTPSQHGLLIVPHHRFYTDPDWSTPIPVAAQVDCDWWPGTLAVLFRLPPPGCVSVFRPGEPYAQAVVVPRPVRVEEMSGRDQERNDAAALYMAGCGLATRQWTTACGYEHDNVYEVLARLERRGRLPAEINPKPKLRML